MKEALLILFVIGLLLALTLLRYRKQISGLIGIARMLKDVKEQVGKPKTLQTHRAGGQLVNCTQCGVWVPENKAFIRGGRYYCSAECANVRV